MNKLLKSEILTNLLWTAFGIIGGLNYYSKGEYWIFGIMSLIAVLYALKLFKSLSKNKETED
ncbi:hypothetical protein [Winogradskyella sp. PG-2]|uniref:hypothetical protein n=1 Tax=Winogradskyella sp. PG-2 TaxID=754409 RepID=UPI0004588091|nr:hypothetical protein [Winogradskyella sp. PG-2]BAO76418.1 hypothetical protein WPG_2188 [Winogradskyella sp. PG-2]